MPHTDLVADPARKVRSPYRLFRVVYQLPDDPRPLALLCYREMCPVVGAHTPIGDIIAWREAWFLDTLLDDAWAVWDAVCGRIAHGLSSRSYHRGLARIERRKGLRYPLAHVYGARKPRRHA